MIRLEDVNNQTTVSDAPQIETAAAETETASKGSHPGNQTADVQTEAAAVTPQTPAPERTIPYTRFSQVNTKLREAQRQLAELQSSQQLNQYDPNDLEQIMAHPLVQDLMIKQARTELTDYARETLDQYPGLHPQLKKAILKNARGFVNETTTDVEAAKLDLAEYIESIVAEEQAAQAQQAPTKQIHVASTNVTNVTPSVRPADIARILEKDITEWTPEEDAIVQNYRQTQPKK